jgi:phage gp36-like protein
MAAYATRADLLAALSHDSQAKLSTDPSRRWTVGSGDGAETTFTTPFLEATALKVYIDGTLLTDGAPALSRGTGAEGRDQIVFAEAPADGDVIAVSADAAAINVDVLDSVLASVSSQIDGYLHAVLPVTDPALLESLRGKAVLLARVRLRGRRNLDVVDPVELEWKAAIRWLEMVAEGKIPLSSGATTGGGEFLSGSFSAVYSDPDGEISL